MSTTEDLRIKYAARLVKDQLRWTALFSDGNLHDSREPACTDAIWAEIVNRQRPATATYFDSDGHALAEKARILRTRINTAEEFALVAASGVKGPATPSTTTSLASKMKKLEHKAQQPRSWSVKSEQTPEEFIAAIKRFVIRDLGADLSQKGTQDEMVRVARNCIEKTTCNAIDTYWDAWDASHPTEQYPSMELLAEWMQKSLTKTKTVKDLLKDLLGLKQNGPGLRALNDYVLAVKAAVVRLLPSKELPTSFTQKMQFYEGMHDKIKTLEMRKFAMDDVLGDNSATLADYMQQIQELAVREQSGEPEPDSRSGAWRRNDPKHKGGQSRRTKIASITKTIQKEAGISSRKARAHAVNLVSGKGGKGNPTSRSNGKGGKGKGGGKGGGKQHPPRAPKPPCKFCGSWNHGEGRKCYHDPSNTERPDYIKVLTGSDLATLKAKNALRIAEAEAAK
jgi:hypothetical protein